MSNQQQQNVNTWPVPGAQGGNQGWSFQYSAWGPATSQQHQQHAPSASSSSQGPAPGRISFDLSVNTSGPQGTDVRPQATESVRSAAPTQPTVKTGGGSGATAGGNAHAGPSAGPRAESAAANPTQQQQGATAPSARVQHGTLSAGEVKKLRGELSKLGKSELREIILSCCLANLDFFLDMDRRVRKKSAHRGRLGYHLMDHTRLELHEFIVGVLQPDRPWVAGARQYVAELIREITTRPSYQD
ncbi:hypothetical protein Hte_005116 [Hypoxylon texense]